MAKSNSSIWPEIRWRYRQSKKMVAIQNPVL